MMTINELYEELELKTDFDSLSCEILPKDNLVKDNSAFHKEFLAFLTLHVFKENKELRNNQEFIDYYTQRFNATKNDFLRARYSHILYLLTHQFQWCIKATDGYKILIEKLNVSEENAYDITKLIKYLILFSLDQKNLRTSIRDDILNYLKNGNRIILIHVGHIIKEHNYFKISEVVFLPSKCLEYAEKEHNYSICKRLLEIGLYYAKKDINQFKQLIPQFYELLGDNERQEIKEYDGRPESLLIPHQNQAIYKQMMEYYNKSGNKTKYEQASKLYCSNKKNLKYLKFTSLIKQNPKVTEFLHNHFDNIKNMSPQIICLYLCLGDQFVFISNERLEECAAKIDEQKFFYQVACDINQNEKKVDDREWYKTKIYETTLNNHLKYIVDVILSSIAARRLTFSLLENFLTNHTYYGEEFKVQRGNNFVSYKWFNLIDIAVKELFLQLSNCISQKETDFRIPIDILSLKFEGILRDIVALKDGAITKIGKNGETSNILLDELLREENVLLNAGFDVDDINLFRFVLTEKGLNLRNNVAHSFYKPQDYTLGNAILIFLCILRLAKFEGALDISGNINEENK